MRLPCRLHQDRRRIEAVLADMPDEQRAGAHSAAPVPCGALGHVLVESGGQGLAEGRHRRGRTPKRCHAVMGRRVGAGHASSLALHLAQPPPLRTVPLSPHATSSSRAQDHARRLVQPSYHETAGACDPCTGGQTRALACEALLTREHGIWA